MVQCLVCLLSIFEVDSANIHILQKGRPVMYAAQPSQQVMELGCESRLSRVWVNHLVVGHSDGLCRMLFVNKLLKALFLVNLQFSKWRWTAANYTELSLFFNHPLDFDSKEGFSLGRCFACESHSNAQTLISSYPYPLCTQGPTSLPYALLKLSWVINKFNPLSVASKIGVFFFLM